MRTKLLNKTPYVLIGIGLIVKIILLPVTKADYICFLEPWMNFISSHGYEKSLKFVFYDYAPTYIYLLVIITKLGLSPLISVKLISIFFEYLLAFFIGIIIQKKHKTHDSFLWGFAIISILPTVILNSSYLSQCDSIYSALVVGSIYYIFDKKQFLSIVFLSLAFTFKMQTAFVLPFYFVLMLRGEIKWYIFFLVPTVYIISTLPAVYYGAPFYKLAGVYFMQADKYKYLTLNFPNLYILIKNDWYEIVKVIGIVFTTFFTIVIGILLKNKMYKFNFETYVRLAFISSILIPFILPGMHERYMFLGDSLSVLYFFVFKKNKYIPIGILCVSTYSYIRLSRYNDILPMEPAFFVYLFVLIFAVSDFILNLKKNENDEIQL